MRLDTGEPSGGKSVRISVIVIGILRAVLPAAALMTLAACAGTQQTAQPAGKLSDIFATPDWAKFTNSKPSAARRPITPDDLITADGRCAGNPEPAAAPPVTEGVAASGPETTSEALAGQGPLPAVQGGVSLAMTECQVAQRTGSPERVDIGAEGTERVTTMTVLRGDWPGLYRFRGGRLVSVERVEVPAPAKPVRPAKSPARTPLRGSQG